eukprot:15462556-Alexandrium_andersonii.AAC.1
MGATAFAVEVASLAVVSGLARAPHRGRDLCGGRLACRLEAAICAQGGCSAGGLGRQFGASRAAAICLRGWRFEVWVP